MSEEREERSFGDVETMKGGALEAVSEGEKSFGERETWKEEGWGILEVWGGTRWKAGEEILGRYVVERELGEGGMGVVYACLDKVSGVRVAVKALPPELSHNSVEMEEVRENFELVYGLSHPNIAGARTLERDGKGEYFLVMEVAKGESLRKWMRQKWKTGGVSLAEAIPILRQVAEALDYAHKMRVVHRDVKPGNVMIDGRGEVKVLDFGLAAQIRTSLSRASRAYRGTSGTGPYMAPEQWKAQPQDGKADQYALGVMAYEMLAGRLPFENSEPSVLKEAVLNDVVPAIPGLPGHAMRALRRAMGKRKEERFGSCGEFWTALEGKGGRRNAHGKTLMGWVTVLALVGAGAWWGVKQAVRPEGSSLQKAGAMEVADEPPASQEEAAKAGARLVVEKAGEEEVGGQPAFSEGTPEEELLFEAKEMLTIADEPVASPEETRQDAALPDIMAELTPEEREAAWKEEKGAEEEARTRLDNLQWTASQMASRLDEFEREPTGFAAHLEKARKAAESIAGAKALGRVAEATTILGEELGWLNRNRAARDAAMAAEREMAESLDPQLREYSASEASASAFERGSAVRRAGNEALMAGAFTEASEKLAEAKTLLTKALGDARAFRAELRVKSAKEYQREERWEKCLEMAKEALVAVPGYEEAEALAKEAEANLVPGVHVEATWEGRQVPATVAYAGESWGTAPLDKTVEEGREYELSLEYKADGKRYAGSITVTGRKGVNRVTIALRERNEPEPGEERDFNLDNGTTIRMVWCPAGSFTMGSPEAEERRYDDEMQHRVTLTKGFWLAKYELTQKQWQAVMGNNPSHWKGDDLPVECVSWNDCKEFCDKTGMRFPTEAEWEYACRAGSTGPYAGDGKLENMGWYRENSGKQTHPVGQKLSNAWGLCDMHGNVWEWCADWYQKYLGSAVARDPLSAGSGLGRVGRGGGCITYASGCRSAIRFYNSPAYRKDSMGFRPARVGP